VIILGFSEASMKKLRQPHPTYSVIKCDLRGNHLKTYSSAARAAEILKVNPGPIYNCINGKLKTAYGFKWLKA
jgi:hypothetical protein